MDAPLLKRSVSQIAESAVAVITGPPPSSDPQSSTSSSANKKPRKPPRDLRSLLATDAYSCFKLINSERGVVQCDICKSDPITRPHKSDLKRHVQGPNHMKLAKARDSAQTVLQFPPRAPASVHLSAGDIFQYLNISHLLCANLPLSSEVLSPTYLAALRAHTPVGPSQRFHLLPEAVKYFRAQLADQISTSYFSILVDETPCRDGVGFTAVLLSTSTDEFVIHAEKLGRQESMDGPRLSSLVTRTLADWNLKPSKLVALVEDNVSYGLTAYAHLRDSIPHLRRIGCLSHSLSLFAKGLCSKKAFPEIHSLLGALRSLVCDSRGKAARALQDNFRLAFDRSHSILDFIELRWSDWLDTLFFVVANRDALFTWVCLQIEEVKEKQKSDNKPKWEKMLVALYLAASELNSICTRALLAILHDLTYPVAKLIKESQVADIVQLARTSHRMVHYVAIVEQRLEGDNLVAYIKSVLSSECLVVKEDLSPACQMALTIGLKKWHKHAGSAVQFLSAIRLLDPLYWINRRFPPDVPSELLFLFSSRDEKLEATLQWRAVGLSSPMEQQLALSGTPLILPDAVATASWWKQIASLGPAPLFGEVAEKLLSIRAGIASVERLFSRLRILDGERRARTGDEVLADELFIVGNSKYTDKFQK